MLRFLAAGFAVVSIALVLWALVPRAPEVPATGGPGTGPAPAAVRPLVLRAPPEADPAGFRAAEQALQAGDRTAFASLLEGLRDDPLYPYLRFAALDADLAAAPDAAIETFLAEFPATAPAERLRAAYVKRLAAAGRWADLVRVYRDDDDSVERRCLYLRALVETGQADAALTAAQLEPLWLVPRPQPAACEPLFAAWRARGGLDPALLWRRIRLAMAAGETALARQLGTRLSAAERPWLERWLAVQARPALVLEAPPATGEAADRPLAAVILADGIARLARSDPRAAAGAFESGRASLAADPAALDITAAAVGRALTAAADPRGLAIWDLMSARVDNLEAQERRLRGDRSGGLGARRRLGAADAGPDRKARPLALLARACPVGPGRRERGGRELRAGRRQPQLLGLPGRGSNATALSPGEPPGPRGARAGAPPQ